MSKLSDAQKIDQALAVLNVAPDLNVRDYSEVEVRNLVTSLNVVYAILNDGRVPDSVRHKPAKAIGMF